MIAARLTAGPHSAVHLRAVHPQIRCRSNCLLVTVTVGELYIIVTVSELYVTVTVSGIYRMVVIVGINELYVSYSYNQ